MTDKYSRRIKQYLNDLLEERDDLCKNINNLIDTANLQVQLQAHHNASTCEKEALLTYLAKMLSVFSELNHSILKWVETVHTPIAIDSNDRHSSTRDHVDTNMQDLKDYLKKHEVKMDQGKPKNEISDMGPKLPDAQVSNDSYVRNPLNDTTLKAICSTIIHEYNAQNNNNLVPNDVPAVVDNRITGSLIHQTPAVVDNRRTGSLIHRNSTPNITSLASNNIPAATEIKISGSLIHQNSSSLSNHPRLSPTLSIGSQSDVFSNVSSSTYHHPLTKFRASTEIPDQYDMEEVNKARENMKFLSRKMGFESEGFVQISSQLDKPSSKINFQYEEPVKDVPRKAEYVSVDESSLLLSTVNNASQDASNKNIMEVKTEKLNNDEASSNLGTSSQQDGGVSSRNTGTVKRQMLTQYDLIEFSESTSDSDSCKKVDMWLDKNRQAEEKANSEPLAIAKKTETVVDKLAKVKRYDRNEEAREKAIADMPDLKLVPVEVPEVIKNDLNSGESSSEKSGKNKNLKVKNLNEERRFYELQEMEPPVPGTICVFSHIISPSEFYLQLVNDLQTANLDRVSEALNTKFSKSDCAFKTKLEAFTKLGKFCYGYIWGDIKQWFRLEVLDWKLGTASDDVYVQAVDFGFKCETPYTYLRELTADLAHIPKLAIKCYFPFLYAPGSTYSNRLTEWSPDVKEAMYDIANLNENHTQALDDITLFEIIFAESEGDWLAVDVVQYPENNSSSLGQILIDMSFAVEIVNEYEDHAELGEFLEDIDELERADNLNEFILGYDARDEARVCKFTRKDGSCYKGKNCKLEHVPLKDGYTTDKTAVFYTAINSLELPCKFDTVQVLVTQYVDSCTYLVQIIRNPSGKEKGTVVDKDVSDLMDTMNQPRVAAKYEYFKILPAVGEIVLAFHPLAKKWVRAAVCEINKDGNESLLQVYSVDFGEEFIVNLKDIRLMLEQFMHIPFQIVQIYLDNYQHKKGCDDKKARKFFDKHIAFKNFVAQIKSADHPFKVNLTTFKGREIGPTLVKEGFAERRLMDFHIADDKSKIGNFDIE